MNVDWVAFAPLSAAIGGVLIGIAAAMLLLVNGRIAGVAGIVGGLLRPRAGDIGWRLGFVVGLLAAPTLYTLAYAAPEIRLEAGSATPVVAGLLAGFGSRPGSGCTSGHGICGMARLSPRSIVATLAFMIAGFVTVFVVRRLR